MISRPGWHEIALWWAAEQTLIVAEALGTAPAFALGRPLGVHPLLRLTPPRGSLGGQRPQRILVGHGPPLEDAADGCAQRGARAVAHGRPEVAGEAAGAAAGPLSACPQQVHHLARVSFRIPAGCWSRRRPLTEGRLRRP